MALEEDIANFFALNGYTWNIKGNEGVESIAPDEEDVRKVLDEAARRLYDGKNGDLILIGRLCVIKQQSGFDVYVLAGSYT